jgi:hypothetical protein
MNNKRKKKKEKKNPMLNPVLNKYNSELDFQMRASKMSSRRNKWYVKIEFKRLGNF